MIAGEPGFGIYIHWPFCAQKCPYCDFNSHVRHKAPDEQRFVEAYLRELDHVVQITGRNQVVTSIFFGGGTPSLMSAAAVGAMLDHIGKRWVVDANAEVTLEANPGSVEAARFAGYRAAGVNRVSLGVQSLHDAELRRLGRIHSVEEARAALAIARSTFDRFSFDLIYARPGQTEDAWRAELGTALALAGDHLSLYQLTIEPDTPYAALHASGRLVVPETEAARRLYDVTQELCEAAGLPAYEISNHARAGEESRHNLLYWRYGAYAGVGAGAHGRLVRAVDGARLSTRTERDPEGWLRRIEAGGHGFIEASAISASEQADEMLLMGMRIGEGVDLMRMAELTGFTPREEAILELAKDGLVAARAEGRYLYATHDGRLVLDWIVTRLSRSLQSLSDRHLPAA